MMFESPTQLSEVDRFKRVIGTYRILEQKMYPHEVFELVWIIKIWDGETDLEIQSFKPVNIPMGCYVDLDIVYQPSHNQGLWLLKKMRLCSVAEVLELDGFQVDETIQNNAAKTPFSQQLDMLKHPTLSKIKQMFDSGFDRQIKMDEQFSFYETDLIQEMVSWLFAIQFENEANRDMAVTGGVIFMIFGEYLNPEYRLDMSIERDMSFSSFVKQGVDTLDKLDPELSKNFRQLMMHTLPLHCTDSKLSTIDFIRAIQLTYMHVITVYEHEHANN